jgi:hypothetical protein
MGDRRNGRAIDPRTHRDHPPIIALREHLEILRAADLRLADERDRRYTAVDLEREKAQDIKNLADQRALDLASDIQHYRDEQANRLREQINSERGLYITKTDHEALIARIDALIKPLAEFVAAQQGRLLGEQGRRNTASDLAGRVTAALSLLVSIVAVAVVIILRR